MFLKSQFLEYLLKCPNIWTLEDNKVFPRRCLQPWCCPLCALISTLNPFFETVNAWALSICGRLPTVLSWEVKWTQNDPMKRWRCLSYCHGRIWCSQRIKFSYFLINCYLEQIANKSRSSQKALQDELATFQGAWLDLLNAKSAGPDWPPQPSWLMSFLMAAMAGAQKAPGIQTCVVLYNSQSHMLLLAAALDNTD